MTPSTRGPDKDLEAVEPDNAVVAQEVIKRTTPGPLRKESDLPRQALEVVLPPFIRHPSCLDGLLLHASCVPGFRVSDYTAVVRQAPEFPTRPRRENPRAGALKGPSAPSF